MGCSILFSTHCTLEHCLLYDSDFGVHIMYSNDTRLLDSRITKSNYMGVLINCSAGCLIDGNRIDSTTGSGIEGSESSDLCVSNNVIYNNSEGIRLYATHGGMIANNSLLSEWGCPIELVTAVVGLRLFNNSMSSTTHSNATDNGIANAWDDGTSLGNAWQDYAGSGLYNVSGTAGSVDHFPRHLNQTEIAMSPWISSPSDVFYYGTTGNRISWYVQVDGLGSFKVFRNNEKDAVLSGQLGEPYLDVVTVNVDGLAPMDVAYTFTLVATDSHGRPVTDTVYVFSLGSTTGITTSNITTNSTNSGFGSLSQISGVITAASVAVIVVVSILIFRARPNVRQTVG